MAEQKESTMKVRLVMSKKSNTILYVEAGKDFVDLLFSFLNLPVASVIKFLSNTEGAMAPNLAITNIYDSVQDLDPTYMNSDKQLLLDPKLTSTPFNGMLPMDSNLLKCYRCNNGCRTFATEVGSICTRCGNSMTIEMKLVENPGKSQVAVKGSNSKSSNSGYVKEAPAFIITDDFNVRPSSSVATIDLLNQLGVTYLRDLETYNITVNFNKALALLRASLLSTTPINDVFLSCVPSPPRKARPPSPPPGYTMFYDDDDNDNDND